MLFENPHPIKNTLYLERMEQCSMMPKIQIVKNTLIVNNSLFLYFSATTKQSP